MLQFHALDSTIGELLVDGWKADKSPEIQSVISSERKKTLEKMFDSLNTLGQDIAIEQVETLTKIPEYQKKQPKPDAFPSDPEDSPE